MYKHIKKHICDAKQKEQKVLITGDFNCKIGEVIKGNRPEISKSGKILNNMLIYLDYFVLKPEQRYSMLWW